MYSNLSVTPYKPSFTALTQINNPSKILSDAEVKTLKALGEKIGDSKNAAITITYKQVTKHPDLAYAVSHATKFTKGNGKSSISDGTTTLPYKKISPMDFGKKLMDEIARSYKSYQAQK